jgi:hypothetical protein
VNKWAELAGYCIEFLRPRSGYFVHDWRDPAPLWRDLRYSLRQRLGAQAVFSKRKI